MKIEKYTVITATAQGIIYHKPSGKKTPSSKLELYSNTYQSKSDKINIKSTKTRMVQDYIELNTIQKQMYNRLMRGLKAYTPEEVACMSKLSIDRITNDYKQTKRVIHIMKAKKCYAGETKLINKIFGTNIGKYNSDWYMDVPKYLTLRRLNISMRSIIKELIQKRLLPRNFFELSNKTINI